ncbi:hypothetical protein L486_01148 [Kwoniella mangroviensis CBS 10435]|uniref:Uncharacterized protein n=1 Tax=Kwoniella mangroviensis CBS 10435 TaxID=1331196 RepID=A0A1B9J139_9TREE|nr:hypothetical protein L486_01148 [Kwoniella mangroviensis CBS 10435]
MSYSVTQADIRYWNAMGSTAAGTSMILALFILVSSCWIYTHRLARHTLDRISFRLLLWSMAWEVGYSTTYLIVCANGLTYSMNGGMKPSFVVEYKKTKACVAGAYFMIGTIGVVNWLCTCIAINLMVTICFNRNPIQLGILDLRTEWLEKWYIIGSSVLGLGVPVIPAIIGHLGEDPVFGSCFNCLIGSILATSPRYLWQILSCVIATVAVIATLVQLIRHGRKTTRLMMGGNSLNKAFHADPENGQGYGQSPASSGGGGGGQTDSSFQDSLPNCLRFNFQQATRPRSTTNRLQDKLFKIALKISLYPISLLIVNVIMTSGDLFLTLSGGINSKGDFIIFLIYNFMFAARGIVFACLGIFVDPCLARGYKAAFQERNESQKYYTESELRVKTPNTGGGFGRSIPMIEISDISPLPYKGHLLEYGAGSEDCSTSKGNASEQDKEQEHQSESAFRAESFLDRVEEMSNVKLPNLDSRGQTLSDNSRKTSRLLAVSYPDVWDSNSFTKSKPGREATVDITTGTCTGDNGGNLIRYVRSESALAAGDSTNQISIPTDKMDEKPPFVNTGRGRGFTGSGNMRVENNVDPLSSTTAAAASAAADAEAEENEIERIFQRAQKRL